MCHRRLLYHHVTVFTVYFVFLPPPLFLSLSLWQPNDDKKLRESDRQRNWLMSNYGFSDGIFLWRTINRRTKSFIIYRPGSPAGRSAKKLDRSNQLLMTVTRNLFERVFEGFVRWCFTTCRSTRLTFQRADIVMLTLSPRMQMNARLSFISSF